LHSGDVAVGERTLTVHDAASQCGGKAAALPAVRRKRRFSENAEPGKQPTQYTGETLGQ
jgi:hypothetical protein